MTNISTRVQISIACCLFILIGLAVIPYLGIQNDEALFASPIYLFNAKDFCVALFHRMIPLMVMSYIGTLKSALYLPIFGLAGVSVWTVRVPMLLCGAATVFFFFNLSLRVAGPAAALIAGFLLATDPSFLLTNTVDWGPVALSHVLLVTGCFFVVRFAQSKNYPMRELALGFFFLGLGLWNKALFLWVLGGIGTGVILVFSSELRRLFSWSRAAVAILAFIFGASPFLIYNFRNPNATLSASAHFDPAAIAIQKLPSLESTLDGSALLGYFTVETWDVPHPKTPASLRGRFAWWIERHLGEHRHSGMPYATCLAVLLVPWWRKQRAAWFSLVFMMVVWAQMAATHDAGGSAHHCILLWPFPQLFVAVALASIPWRPATWIAGIVLVAMNLLVLDKYLVDFERNGAGLAFSDALFPLSDALAGVKQPVWVMDWGILDAIDLMQQGRLDLHTGDSLLMRDQPTPEEQQIIGRMLSNPDALYVGHVSEAAIFKQVSTHLQGAMAASGRQKQLLRTIFDSNGRPVFEIFRVRPAV